MKQDIKEKIEEYFLEASSFSYYGESLDSLSARGANVMPIIAVSVLIMYLEEKEKENENRII